MNVLAEGIGKVFTNPDADKAREFFRTKSRKLESKVMTVKEAVEKFTKDGDYLVVGGFGANRIPASVCHELLRQGRKNMGFAGHTSTHDFQILCAGEVFNKLDVAYIVGLEARGLSANARRYMESGKVDVSRVDELLSFSPFQSGCGWRFFLSGAQHYGNGHIQIQRRQNN